MLCRAFESQAMSECLTIQLHAGEGPPEAALVEEQAARVVRAVEGTVRLTQLIHITQQLPSPTVSSIQILLETDQV